MHGIIPYMFDYWADPVVHLLLLTKELHGQGMGACTWLSLALTNGDVMKR